ncbi:MAG: hypothetical protein JJU10_10235 [Idiomarina sp.]|nr:hypothetical protein [Idiomarina sp.]
MREIQRIALITAAIAVGLAWLIQTQASHSAATENQGAALLMVMLCVPLLFASMLFSTLSSLQLLRAKAREDYGLHGWQDYFLCLANAILALVYWGALLFWLVL